MKEAMIIFLLVLLAGCTANCVTIESSGGSYHIDVEYARTVDEMNKGLMFRDSLDDDAGMLFVWEDEAPRSFWMKNTRIPLDIIFISGSNEIINILQAEPCTSDPCPTYNSAMPAKYVLEANRGFCAARGISPGDKVTI